MKEAAFELDLKKQGLISVFGKEEEQAPSPLGIGQQGTGTQLVWFGRDNDTREWRLAVQAKQERALYVSRSHQQPLHTAKPGESAPLWGLQ